MNKNKFIPDEFESDDCYIDNTDLKEHKEKDKHLKIAFKEVFLCLIFAGLTLTVAYEMVDIKAYNYQLNLKNIFGSSEKSTSFIDVIFL